MNAAWTILGTPSGAGACGVGQDQAPRALREAGLIDALRQTAADVKDTGDSPVTPWRPDRTTPHAQNLPAVIDAVRSTATRVTDALADTDRRALVLGGDCTVGIGTIAGTQQALGDDVAVVYFDLHSDLNTPATAPDGALDWMALANLLGTQGSEPALTHALGSYPILRPDQVFLFGQDPRHATRHERAELERLQLPRTPLDDVRKDPESAARQTLQSVQNRASRYVIHLDADVVDFTDAPLSEHPSRNAGLKLNDMLAALQVLASGDGLAAITLAEVNPHNAAADPGLLERFSTEFASAITS